MLSYHLLLSFCCLKHTFSVQYFTYILIIIFLIYLLIVYFCLSINSYYCFHVKYFKTFCISLNNVHRLPHYLLFNIFSVMVLILPLLLLYILLMCIYLKDFVSSYLETYFKQQLGVFKFSFLVLLVIFIFLCYKMEL